MDRYRLIGAIIFLFIYLLSRYPWQTIVTVGIIFVAYIILNNLRPNDMIERNAREDRRRMALKAASMYLSPYKNIWGNLKLSNKFCSLRLNISGTLITARETEERQRSFYVTSSKTHSYEDLWNMLCYRFNHNTTFDELIELSEKFNTTIKITDNAINIAPLSDNKRTDIENNAGISNLPNKKENRELLDVNNASEVELTALPGISIVMAKKIIKKREEIGGFKSVSDVFSFLKLKPHMQTQLEKLICVKKMKGSLKINRYNERSVDI